MKKKILALFVALVVAAGWVIFEARTAQTAAGGKTTPPVIVQSFAPKELKPGDVWKVYLKASDPEGKMKYIFATVSQPGADHYPIVSYESRGRIRKNFLGTSI